MQTENGIVYEQWYDPLTRNDRSRSLGRVDWSAAIRHAEEQVARLRLGLDEMRTSEPTVRRVTRLYRRFRSPDKKPAQQEEDDRHIEFIFNVLGPDFDLGKLSRREFDMIKRLSRRGEVDCRGNPIESEKNRKPTSGGGRRTYRLHPARDLHRHARLR